MARQTKETCRRRVFAFRGRHQNQIYTEDNTDIMKRKECVHAMHASLIATLLLLLASPQLIPAKEPSDSGNELASGGVWTRLHQHAMRVTGLMDLGSGLTAISAADGGAGGKLRGRGRHLDVGPEAGVMVAGVLAGLEPGRLVGLQLEGDDVRIEGTEGVEELFVGGFHVEGLAGLGMLVLRTREGVWRHGDIHKARNCSYSTLCSVVLCSVV